MLFALVGNIGLILRCLLLFGTLVIGCFLFLFSPVYAADITTSVFVPRAFINEPVEIKVAAIELVRILKEVFPGCTFSETVKLLTTIN